MLVAVAHPDVDPADYKADYVINRAIPPEKWLLIIDNSLGYFGERFHPIVISVFLGKSVFSVYYYSHGKGFKRILNNRSKTKDFLDRTGHEARYCSKDIFFKKERPEHIAAILLNNNAPEKQIKNAQQRVLDFFNRSFRE